MPYPALIGYYQPPTDILPPSVDLYYAPNGAEEFHLHDHLTEATTLEDRYTLPDFSTIDKSPVSDSTNLLSARDIALEELGDAIDYYDVYALYLQTPDELYTYATVPLWPDINRLFAKGVTAAVYPGEAITNAGTLHPDATPLATLDSKTFESPLDQTSDAFQTLAKSHRNIIHNAKRIVSKPNYTHDPDDPPVLYSALDNGNYVAATIDRPQMFQTVTDDGALIKVDDDFLQDDESLSKAAHQVLSTTNQLRTYHSQPVWEEHLKALSNDTPIFLEATDKSEPDTQSEDRPDPQQTAINEAYRFTMTLLDRYQTKVSPLSASLFADEIATRTDSTIVDFVGQTAPEI
jgi:hypothetical protein